MKKNGNELKPIKTTAISPNKKALYLPYHSNRICHEMEVLLLPKGQVGPDQAKYELWPLES